MFSGCRYFLALQYGTKYWKGWIRFSNFLQPQPVLDNLDLPQILNRVIADLG